MMCSTVPELQQDKRASARVLRLPCQRSRVTFQHKRPVFQMCSCANPERPMSQRSEPVPRVKIPTIPALFRGECYAMILLYIIQTVIVVFVARPPPPSSSSYG